jgi:hypothetical protein
LDRDLDLHELLIQHSPRHTTSDSPGTRCMGRCCTTAIS